MSFTLVHKILMIFHSFSAIFLHFFRRTEFYTHNFTIFHFTHTMTVIGSHGWGKGGLFARNRSSARHSANFIRFGDNHERHRGAPSSFNCLHSPLTQQPTTESADSLSLSQRRRKCFNEKTCFMLLFLPVFTAFMVFVNFCCEIWKENNNKY